MGKNNYIPEINAHGNSSGATQASFNGYNLDSVTQETDLYFDQHLFNIESTFPQLSEYSKVNLENLNLGLPQSMMSFSKDALASIKMVQSAGSFKNVLGYYTTSEDGTIRDVSIAFSNTRAIESGIIHSFDIDASKGSLNFFLLGNGYNLNKVFAQSDLESGNFNFIYHHGQEDQRAAKVTDEADDITLIYQAGNGEITTVRGPVYHATDHASGSQINSDGDTHVVSGLAENEGQHVLRIGFEDFPGLGDADFNDVVFDLNVSYLNPNHTNDVAVINQLTNIEPANGDTTEKRDDNSDPNSQFIQAPDGSFVNQSGESNKEISEYITSQVSKILPDLANAINENLFEEFGERMNNNYETLFAQYVFDHYQHIYNEIQIDFNNLEVATILSDNGQDAFDIVGHYDDAISSISQVDEAISNFIALHNDEESSPGTSPVDHSVIYTSMAEEYSLADNNIIVESETII